MMNQNGMEPQDQRNFILAMVLMVAFVFFYQSFVMEPSNRRAKEAYAKTQAAQADRKSVV